MKERHFFYILIGILAVILIVTNIYYFRELEYYSEENDRLFNEVHDLKMQQVNVTTTHLNFIASDNIDENIYEAMGHFKILFPDIVYAQSILETGYYSSTLCTDSNNILGLYDSSLKQYRKYDYWWESIYDYKRLIQNKYKGNKDSIEEYFIFLDTLPYAQDTTYVNKLKEVYYELNFE